MNMLIPLSSFPRRERIVSAPVSAPVPVVSLVCCGVVPRVVLLSVRVCGRGALAPRTRSRRGHGAPRQQAVPRRRFPPRDLRLNRREGPKRPLEALYYVRVHPRQLGGHPCRDELEGLDLWVDGGWIGCTCG